MGCNEIVESLSFVFLVNGERQGLTLAEKYWFNHFVANSISHVEGIIKH
jgi:hypothetical protein